MKKNYDHNRKWARPDQVADYLNVSKRSVYRMAEEGVFIAMRVRHSLRIRMDSVFDYEQRQIVRYSIETGTVPGVPKRDHHL